MNDNKDLVLEAKSILIDSLLEEPHCQAFLERLKKMKEIDTFCIMGNSYGKQFFKELLAFKDQITSIKKVILKDIFTSRKEEILDSLSYLNEFLANKNILLFDLSQNAICPDGCLRIKDIIETNPQMKYLYLNHVALSQAGTVTVTDYILNSKVNLLSFQATKNRIEIEAQKLAEIFKQMPDLQDLVLFQNNIKDGEMAALLKNLKECKNLKNLDLSDNYLNDEHIELLIEVLKENKGLEVLRIGDCNISEEGSLALLKYLQSNKGNLKQLAFNYNEVEDIKDFVQQLKCLELERLEIKGIADFDDFEEIKEIIPECKMLLESDQEEDEDLDEQQKLQKNVNQLMQDLQSLQL